jgi:hypothetical protein
MKIHNVEQRTQDWFMLKKGVIGGTLAKGLFVKSDTLLNDLISQMIEDFDDEEGYVSFDMQRGIDLEPIAREELSREVFVKFNEVGFITHDTIKILGISPDGLNEDGTIQCEIKSPASKKHTQTIRQDEIPSDNIHQVLHAFVVNEKLEKNIFCSYRPENNICPLWYKVVTRDTEIDLGTKAKPNIKTVQEWVDIALTEAELLDSQVDAELKRLEEKYCS